MLHQKEYVGDGNKIPIKAPESRICHPRGSAGKTISDPAALCAAPAVLPCEACRHRLAVSWLYSAHWFFFMAFLARHLLINVRPVLLPGSGVTGWPEWSCRWLDGVELLQARVSLLSQESNNPRAACWSIVGTETQIKNGSNARHARASDGSKCRPQWPIVEHAATQQTPFTSCPYGSLRSFLLPAAQAVYHLSHCAVRVTSISFHFTPFHFFKSFHLFIWALLSVLRFISPEILLSSLLIISLSALLNSLSHFNQHIHRNHLLDHVYCQFRVIVFSFTLFLLLR